MIPRTSSSPTREPQQIFTLYSDPLSQLSAAERQRLHSELIAFASLSFDPVPDYHILSSSMEQAFENTILVLAHDTATHPWRLVGFACAVWLDIPGAPTRVLDIGLSVVAPSARRTGLLTDLNGRVLRHTLEHDYPHGHWVLAISSTCSVLGVVARSITEVYPAPTARPPTAIHLAIARWVSTSGRSKFRLDPAVTFDETSFVLRGCALGSSFMSNMDDAARVHRNETYNNFYRRLIRHNSGDEVLQVGFLEPKHFAKTVPQQRLQDKPEKVRAML